MDRSAAVRKCICYWPAKIEDATTQTLQNVIMDGRPPSFRQSSAFNGVRTIQYQWYLWIGPA